MAAKNLHVDNEGSNSECMFSQVTSHLSWNDGLLPIRLYNMTLNITLGRLFTVEP